MVGVGSKISIKEDKYPTNKSGLSIKPVFIFVSTELKCFKKLTETHYLIHAHGNNYGRHHNVFPDVIELTYLNKKCFNNVPPFNTVPFPIPDIDFPNNSHARDIPLNFYPFVNNA